MGDKFCWFVIVLAAFFFMAVGCGGDDKCPQGTQGTEPGVCHVPSRAGSGAPDTVTMVVGGDTQISEPDEVAGSGGKYEVGESGHGGKGGSGGSQADSGTPDSGHTEHDAGPDSGSSSETGGAESGNGGSNSSQIPTAGTIAPPSADAGEPMTMAGMMAPPPPPAPRCGDGHIDSGETCDGDCVSSCDDGDPCTTDVMTGSVIGCDVSCKHTAITTPKAGDGCCPSKANANTDTDCSATCGNGVKESNEACDGNCPQSCDDNNPCTEDAMVGSADRCNAVCSHRPITSPKSGDKCCPSGANAINDTDCIPTCGNGARETGELCDGDCPTSCPAPNGCTRSSLTGSASACNAVCATTTISNTVDGDGCCPSGANYNSDNDCAPPSGCTEPSSSNMLLNPGFATGINGWSLLDNGGEGPVTWSSGDYESCPISGSAQFSARNAISRTLSQCLPITGGNYHFSARIKSGGNGGQTTCAVVAYQLAGCTGGAKAMAEATWLNVDWGPATSYAFDVESTFQSVLVACYLNAMGVDDDAVSVVDQLYLGRADAAF